jgi:hypothetical protein
MFFFDPLYLLFAMPALLLGLWAQIKVKGAFNRYSRVRSARGLTGAEVARRVLDFNGLHEVQVEQVGGFLSDHYDPRHKTLRLSPDVYRTPSLAAAGIAAHEAGHAIQDKQGYTALKFRTSIVPAVQIGSWLGPIIFLVGLFIPSTLGESIAWLGLILFGLTALFAVVTLPVEFDATRRAKQSLVTQGILGSEEMVGVNKTLDAAALTYVAAAIQAVMTLLYYTTLLVGRRDD